jgi:hypothetical protein
LVGRVHWSFDHGFYEKNVSGLAVDPRVNRVLGFVGDNEAYQAGHADLERIIERLMENANAEVKSPSLDLRRVQKPSHALPPFSLGGR